MDEKTSLNSTIDVKLNYIQRDLNVILADVKEIKKDYVTRREFENSTKNSEAKEVLKNNELDEKTATRFTVVEKQVNTLYKVVYWIIGLSGTAIAGAIYKLILR